MSRLSLFFYWTLAALIIISFCDYSWGYLWESQKSLETEESFVPIESDGLVDQVETRFVRQVSSTLKKQNSRFNDDAPPVHLPEDVVPLDKNTSLLGAPVNLSGYEEHHIYYNVSFYNHSAESYYVDLDRYNGTVNHDGLSKAHLKAAGITLNFTFPFYGYRLNNLTLATGGFLYTGNPDHSWIAATQYIAPLMADFDLLVRNDSRVRYLDNGTSLTVEWENVVLHEKKEVGPFTFQATLKDDGTIIFYYQQVPISIVSVPNETHPVKVGISDAYMIDRQRFIIRYRTIYEYHRISLNTWDIANNTALILEALPTCIAQTSCESCLRHTALGCMWCEALERCSDGVDRFHQEWYAGGCHVSASNTTCNASLAAPLAAAATTPKMTVKLTKPITKPGGNKTGSAEGPLKKASSDMSDYATSSRNRPAPSTANPGPAAGGLSAKSKYTMLGSNVSGSTAPGMPSPLTASQETAPPPSTNYAVAIAVVLVVVAVTAALGWVVYAYLRPQTPSGQWLIKYRPNQWRRNRDDEIQIASTPF
ncbi:plexin domain-containing protein 2-like [Paramacrobiotus metropolitanus]|uniref:plexin domain-containing protein 2-like n=1 Tax=Paramacrobiotus metropolitanus TaxID=2943436 RepID=UPI002445BAE2|nr:plexin domain-containing protein 2-like [Paramacrobiotus metropolitanus]